jgi:acetyltransferase-like isoleucine patch superfamily enzyme
MTSEAGPEGTFALGLREAYAARDDYLRSHYARSLPIQDAFDDRWRRASKLGFGDGASIYNSAVVYGDVRVGVGTWIGPYVVLDGSGGLTVGSWCSISCGVHIYSHDTVEWALSGGKRPYNQRPVSIGDCCYIGSQVVVAAGVSIGDQCVVSANSFVKDDVASRTVVGGTPARRIGEVIFDGETPRIVYDHQRPGKDSVRDYMNTVLVRIAQESFGRRDAPEVTLSPDTTEDARGALTGVLEMRIRTRDGKDPVIQREAFSALRSKEDVDDVLAHALSILLMNHAEWPR